MNWGHFKNPVCYLCYLCLTGAVVASRSLTQEATGSKNTIFLSLKSVTTFGEKSNVQVFLFCEFFAELNKLAELIGSFS